MTPHLIQILTLMIAAVSIGAFVLLRLLNKEQKKYKELFDKYKGVVDLDSEKEKIKLEIEKLTSERTDFLKGFNDKKSKLESDYNQANEIYQKLKTEKSRLEEDIEVMEFGVYKPHFEFNSSEDYRKKVLDIVEKQKDLIKQDKGTHCPTEWTVGGSKSEGKKMVRNESKLMLRAFNGECDSAILKVRWDNVLKMEDRIRHAFDTINKTGETVNTSITQEYCALKIEELRLSHELQIKIREEKEEQKRIREDMREEEKARIEIEKAKDEAEKEETRYQKALEKAREEISKSSGAESEKLIGKITELERKLELARQEKERAISRAQQTKSGHVYIISNIGSFGENVFKIGMTRRLEPMDRVEELGNASVPFEFDVHAMVYSENAPDLEHEFHKYFDSNRINLVNNRKEFFSLGIEEIEKWALENKLEISLTKLAEAREYRETINKRIVDKGTAKKIESTNEFPKDLTKIFTN